MKYLKLTKDILFYVITAFFVLYLMLIVIVPKKVVNIIGFRTYHIVTSSMVPKYKEKTMIVVAKTNKETLKVGDIITFETYVEEKGQIHFITVTHYVGKRLEIDGEVYYQTQTYKNYHNEGRYDEWVDKSGLPLDNGIHQSQVIGKVAFGIPLIGYLTVLLQTIILDPVLLILVILNIVIIVYLIKYLKKPKGDDDKDDLETNSSIGAE